MIEIKKIWGYKSEKWEKSGEKGEINIRREQEKRENPEREREIGGERKKRERERVGEKGKIGRGFPNWLLKADMLLKLYFLCFISCCFVASKRTFNGTLPSFLFLFVRPFFSVLSFN